MSGRIPREFIDDLLVRVDIVDLIDSHLPLKKAGSNFVARCPFHSEKTPSFSVNRAKQFFHCFGCGASGNAIGFLMDFSHLDFVEAVEDLAAFAGISVPKETYEYRTESNRENLGGLYLVSEQVATFYNEQLKSHPGRATANAYLNMRGVSDEVVRDFLLGYAPDEWSLLSNRFDQKSLVDVGLLGKNDAGRVYDRFRGRIMFPIRDKRARVIGFGGRVLDDSLPKYLNSPETVLFHKGKEVYGLYELLQKNPKPKRVLVVEGYMDVIALAQFGIHYAVATLGTAVTQTHLDLLFRYSAELIFCFDGDSAGQAAAWRALSSVFPSLKDGRQIRIMLLPQNHDPDSLIREQGLDIFIERMQTAQALSDYFFEHFSRDLKLSEIEGRANLKKEAEVYLKQLPIGAFREMMFEELSRLSRRHIVDNEAVDVYKKSPKMRRQRNDRLSLPSSVMALLVQNPRLIEVVERKKIDWNYLEFEGIEKFTEILNVVLKDRPANHGILLELYRGHIDELVIKKLASWDLLIPEEGVEKEFSDALDKLLAQARTTGLEKLLAKEKINGLDSEEKELLRKMLANK
ncbi:MAG: DNA primase [Methylococcaceae bacterium]|nr:DNA primase [Methylococcaceae bacterium]